MPTRSILLRLLGALLVGTGSLAGAADFSVEIPLTRHASGNFYVAGDIGGVHSTFLVDTGSGLTTVSERTLDALRRVSPVERVGRVAARMASGRLKKVDLYRVEHFRIGDTCDLGAIDVAVLSRDETGIIGLDALTRAAPFAFHVDPPRLAVSGCANLGQPVAAR